MCLFSVSLYLLFFSTSVLGDCKIGDLDLTPIEKAIISCNFTTDYDWTLSYSPCRDGLHCTYDYWNGEYMLVEYRNDLSSACFWLANSTDIPKTSSVTINGTKGYQLKYAQNTYENKIINVNFLCDSHANSSVSYTTCNEDMATDVYNLNIFGNLSCSGATQCQLKPTNSNDNNDDDIINLNQFNTTIINSTYTYNNNEYEIEYAPCAQSISCFDTKTNTNYSSSAININTKSKTCSDILGFVNSNTKVDISYSKNDNEWQIIYNNPHGCFDINTDSTFIIYWKCNISEATYNIISSLYYEPCLWKLEIESIAACTHLPSCYFQSTNTNNTLNLSPLNNATLIETYNQNKEIQYTPCVDNILNCNNFNISDIIAVDYDATKKYCDNILASNDNDITTMTTIEIMDNGVKTWQINYQTKHGCDGVLDSEFIVKWACDKAASPYKISNVSFNQPCLFTMAIQTLYAC